jgi:hypothetical protein
MLYNSIREFNSLVDRCPFCHHPLNTALVPKTDSVNNNYIVRRVSAQSRNFYVTFERDGNLFESREDPDQIVFYSIFNCSRNKVFSINIDTNCVAGCPVENIQRIILNNELVLLRKCSNKKCVESGSMFVYQSSLLTLGTLSKKIYPVTISLEIIITTINGQKFSLLSMEDHNSTYLLDDKNMITTLPKLELHNMLDESLLVKKIKTYVLFS